MAERLKGLAGIQSATWTSSVPFSYSLRASAPITVDGFVFDRGEQPSVEYAEVGPGYFAIMGIPLFSGQDFTRADNETALPVAVVNQTMAERFWHGADPIGRRLQVNGRWLQVVGVARNSKYWSFREAPQPYFYMALRQGSNPGESIQIRTWLGPAATANALAREVKALDVSLAPTEVITMREQIDRTSWSQHAAFRLLTAFGAMALLLTAVGLYGVMSYSVSQRTRELGLRMALGAEGSDLLRIVMRYGIGLAVAGIAVGSGVAAGTTRLMGDLLYKVSPRDPAVFAWAFAVMATAAMACLIPALRVMRTDPVRALRGE